jgi:small GTP-binding protein
MRQSTSSLRDDSQRLTLLSLPDELLESCLHHLEPSHLGSLAMVCAHLSVLSKSDSIWRPLYLRDRPSGPIGDATRDWRDAYYRQCRLRFGPAPKAGICPERVPLVCKLILVGDSNVGKSAFLRRFALDEFVEPDYRATIGIDFRIKSVTFQGDPMKLQVWDTAGQERFRAITEAYYRNAHGCLLTFDLSDRASFEHIPQWAADARLHGPAELACLLVGLKDEHHSEVSDAEAEQMAERVGACAFVACSSMTGEHVEEAVYRLVREVRLAQAIPALTLPPAPSAVAEARASPSKANQLLQRVVWYVTYTLRRALACQA